MRACLLALSILLASIVPAVASRTSFDYRTLQWEWLGAAELVVLGEVRLTTDAAEDVASHLEIVATLKGECARTMRVPEAGAAARHGELVIAFLQESEPGVWAPVCAPGHSGILRVDETKADVLLHLVRTGLDLQASTQPREDARLSWHVLAASREATRWYGLPFLLGTRGGTCGRPSSAAPPPVVLTLAHRHVLAEGFVREPPSTTFGEAANYLRLLDGFASAETDAAAVAVLESDLKNSRSGSAGLDALLTVVLGRLGDKTARIRVAHARGERKRLEIEDARRLWADARDRYR